MGGRRRRKQEAQEHTTERSKALLSPESLPIQYNDLRRGSVETKPLSEFLVWAKEEKLVVYTRAYHDYAYSGKLPTVEAHARVWCPCIETDCMIPQNTAEEFYPHRNAMYVDDFSKQVYRPILSQVIEREKAFRNHRRLMREQIGGSEKAKKVVGEEKSSHKDATHKDTTAKASWVVGKDSQVGSSEESSLSKEKMCGEKSSHVNTT